MSKSYWGYHIKPDKYSEINNSLTFSYLYVQNHSLHKVFITTLLKILTLKLSITKWNYHLNYGWNKKLYWLHFVKYSGYDLNQNKIHSEKLQFACD